MDISIRFERINKEIDVNKLCDCIKPNIEDTVFLAGSLIEEKKRQISQGMGNKNSDIDIFIITENFDSYKDAVYDEGFCKTTFFRMDDFQYDVEVYDYFQFANFLDMMNSINFDEYKTDDIRLGNLIAVDEIVLKRYMSLIHRLLNSIVIFNPEKYDSIFRQIKRDNYYVFNQRYYTNLIDLNYDDVIGFISEKQYIMAIQITRKMLIYAIGAYLFANEISFDREKWIPLLIENLAKQESEGKKYYKEFIRLYLEGLENDDKMERNVKESLVFVNNIISFI